MLAKDIIGIGMAIIVLAGISVALMPGGATAEVIKQSGESFAKLITAATHPGG